MAQSWEELIEGLKAGNVRALARMITRVENRDAGWKAALKALYPDTGRARILGVTGSPGAGKSTLTNQLAKRLVARGLKVGVIAVDPSSPFSGGALLGDRLRMQDVFTTPGVFIRSMATRGALGGLCQAARDVTRLLDAFGHDVVVIETVGVGQDEIEVVRAADLVMVVCVPGQGDGVQALKAGIMEIADVFVVNKADRDGADETAGDIKAMLDLSAGEGVPLPPVFKVSALKEEGIAELADALLEKLERLDREKAWGEARIREELLTLMEREVFRRIRREWGADGALDEAVRRVASRESDPYSVVEELLDRSEGSAAGGEKEEESEEK